MKEVVTKGTICLNDPYRFVYKIARIEYHEREDETFRYVFRPNYSVIDLLPEELYQGIPGLNMELRKEEYVRENITPVFISERTPGKNREDLQELLEREEMEYLNRLEWLIRTDMKYSGDPLYVIRDDSMDDKNEIQFEVILEDAHRSADVVKRLLCYVCAGENVVGRGFRIDDGTRKNYYNLLIALYGKEKKYIDAQRHKGIERAVSEKKYKGRKPIPIDEIRLREVCEAYCKGEIREKGALEQLGITRATFFRRLKKYRDKISG